MSLRDRGASTTNQLNQYTTFTESYRNPNYRKPVDYRNPLLSLAAPFAHLLSSSSSSPFSSHRPPARSLLRVLLSS